MTGFSFSKLTDLQVQGARERASRKIEASQLAGRFSHVDSRWKRKIHRDTNDAKEAAMHAEAIIEAFSQDNHEISPFMVARLADLCRQEFRSIQIEKALERFDNEHSVLFNLMHEEIEIAGKEKYQVEKELKARIKILEDEVWNRGHGNMYIEQKRAESLREALEWKRREILKLREQKLHELEEMEKEKHFAPKPSKPVLVEKWNDSSYSWVDVEDDDSEWVLFS